MDFIARADNHPKKGKRARRHSYLWTNMTCNLLSCEKHKGQQLRDVFFQDTEKLITGSGRARAPSPADPEQLGHPCLPRASVRLDTSDIGRSRKKRDRATDPLHRKGNVWGNGQ